MKPTNKKCLRITELDFLLANRKAAREEEILAHGKPIIFRIHLQNSKNRYNRMQMKKAIIRLGDGFIYLLAIVFLPLVQLFCLRGEIPVR